MLRLFLAGWLLTAALSLFAQPQQDSVPALAPVEILDSVMATLRTHSDRVRVERDSLGQFAASTSGLEGVLRQVPGVQVMAYGGHGGLSAVSLRGFAASMTAFTIDGLPYQPMQTGIVNFGAFLPDAFQSISVLPQPLSPDLNPLGGVVAAEGVSHQRFVRTKVAAGSFGEKQFHAASGLQLGHSHLLSAFQRTRATDAYPFEYAGVSGTRTNNRFGTDQLWLSQSHYLGRNRTFRLRVGVLASRTFQDVPEPVVAGTQPSDRGDSLFTRDVFAYVNGETPLTANRLHSLAIKASWHYNDLRFYGRSNTPQRPFDQYLNSDVLIQAGTTHVWRRHVLQTSLQGMGAWLNGNNLAVNFLPVTFVRRLQANAGISHVWYVRAMQEKNAFRVSTTLRLNLPEGYQLYPNWAITVTSLPGGDTGRWEIFGHLHYGYRIPSFNELYYFGYGNARLKPELARSMNYGLYYRTALRRPRVNAALRMTVFYNNVLNKIISVPINPAVWSTYAIGETQCVGAEWVAEASWRRWQAHYSYTLQKALDVTRPERPLLPYTPRESLTYGIRYESSRWHGWINGAFSGWRFATRNNQEAAFMPGFHVLDAGGGHTWAYRTWHIRLEGQMANLLNQRYAVIQGYPMPPRSARLTLIVQG